MIRFTTDDIAPEDRFDHWRNIRGKDQFGVTIELPPERRRTFVGSFHAHAVGSAIASDIRASAYRVSRTPGDIARVAGNSLCISLQLKGGGLLDVGRDRISAIGDGDMTIGFSDLPYAGRPHGEVPFHYRMLRIPFDDETMLGRPVHDLLPRRHVGEAALSRPLRALFDALADAHCRQVDPTRDVAHFARLALAARGRLSRAMPEIRAALRAGRRYAALEIVARDKCRPNLTPSDVAAELGISVRHLHLLFEETELSFSQTLSAARISEAERLLTSVPDLPVTEVAYASGFESLATFYRAFHKAHDMAPGDMRAAAGRDRRALR